MLSTRFAAGMAAVTMAVLSASLVSAQDFPSKPIRVITSAAGGGNDFTIRSIAPGLTSSLGQPVIVDNRNAIAAIEAVAKAPPDGYALLLTGSILWIGPLLQSNATWDPVRDFSPVVTVVSSPSILVVHPSVPVKSVKELLSLAKARPGELNMASGASGTPQHLAGELFKAVAKVNIVSVPYNGSGPSIIAVISGEVQMMFPTAASVAQHIKTGRLRALAVTSAQPSELLPGLPTVAAAVPGYEAISIQPVFAPAGTPANIINRLNQGIVRVLNQPDVKKRFLDDGSEIVGSSPEQLATKVKSELAIWGKLIRESGIRAQ